MDAPRQPRTLREPGLDFQSTLPDSNTAVGSGRAPRSDAAGSESIAGTHPHPRSSSLEGIPQQVCGTAAALNHARDDG